MMDVYGFIKEIKRIGLFKVKQSIVVEGINIYVNDGEVYKIMLHVNPAMMKKAKKLGLNSEYVIYDMKDKGYKLLMDEKCKKGKFIVMYDVGKNESYTYDGENSELEQAKKYIKKLRCSCS